MRFCIVFTYCYGLKGSAKGSRPGGKGVRLALDGLNIPTQEPFNFKMNPGLHLHIFSFFTHLFLFGSVHSPSVRHPERKVRGDKYFET